ncbi:class I SAM-dependent methyltransferase [Streptomyces sp. NRRL B-24484]|uniref:class I SAM-dependent methyltransferase n=1 Tax=Streptomyces sp. NRRL B-24484 TaxID=1463833 RepID=UPI000A5973BA|nr:class I SAM-dependent methyltransferase [Streptomyces sp. NRRL B-24484]
MAGEFDAHERRMWEGKAVPYQRTFAGLCGAAVPELVAAAGVGPGAAVLDVGTGPGTAAAAAVRLGARVTAVDAEPGMVALAAENVPAADVRHAVLPVLPFADASFDAVVANFVINHVEDPAAALAELRRVTRPGGRIAVTVWAAVGNTALGLFAEALDAAGAVRPAFPPLPVDFDRTPEGLAGLLAGAGWRNPEGRHLAWTHRVSPEEFWQGPASGIANLGLVITGLPPATAALVKQHYDRIAGGRTDGDGLLALPAAAVLAVARR